MEGTNVSTLNLVENIGSVRMLGLFSIPALLLTSCSSDDKSQNVDNPNFVVIYVDDMGYGDVGVYGHPTIKTPNLDQMAAEGQKWTSFYSPSSVCTPSRAGLLTGRLAVRSGLTGVLFPHSETGLPQSENTIAGILKNIGYQTAAIGKWHLGHESPFLPTDHGFDSYYGIPYSNDMNRQRGIPGKNWVDSQIILAEKEDYEAYDVPLMRDTEIIERPVDQRTITKRYTEEAITQIKNMKDGPFFLYLAHTMPHIPLFRAEEFKGVSLGGIYGDVIEEIDWSVGEILRTLKEEGIDDNTFVIFTSDNGHWHIFRHHAGTSAMFRGAKGGAFEGGMRVPAIMRWPGQLKKGTVMEMGSALDLLPTFCAIVGIELPNDREYDGYDISPLLFGTGEGPRDEMFYYRGNTVFAVRKGAFKAHFHTNSEFNHAWGHPVTEPPTEIINERQDHDPPLLFNLNTDPGERFNIADEHPETITEIRKLLEEHKTSVTTSK